MMPKANVIEINTQLQAALVLVSAVRSFYADSSGRLQMARPPPSSF